MSTKALKLLYYVTFKCLYAIFYANNICFYYEMETVECLFCSMDILITLFVSWSLMPPFQMVRTYKKKSEGGRANYATSEAMVAAYNSVIKKEMSAN